MSVHQIGFRVGLIAFSFATAYVIAQILQLLRVLPYPWDEILIYSFSLGIVVPFIVEMLALHYAAPTDKKFWSHAALLFATLYAVFVTSNYVVQLATVIPATLKGTSDEIELLKQTPHSLFWDFDAIGYVFMGLATLFAIPLFESRGFHRWVRYSLLANSLVTPVIAFVYFYPDFSDTLLLFGAPWGITAPLFMLMFALVFKKGSFN